MAAYEEGSKIRGQLVEMAPTDVEYQRALANSVMNIGLVEKDRGQFGPAGKQLQAAQKIRQEQLAANGDSMKMRRDLAMGSYNQGLLDLKLDQPKSAASHFNEAIERFEQLHQADPRDLTLSFLLATCYRLSADAQNAGGTSVEAVRLYGLRATRLHGWSIGIRRFGNINPVWPAFT